MAGNDDDKNKGKHGKDQPTTPPSGPPGNGDGVSPGLNDPGKGKRGK